MLHMCVHIVMDQHVELLCSILTTHKLMYVHVYYLLASCIHILLAYN